MSSGSKTSLKNRSDIIPQISSIDFDKQDDKFLRTSSLQHIPAVEIEENTMKKMLPSQASESSHVQNHRSTSSVDIVEFEEQRSTSLTPQSLREYLSRMESSLSETQTNLETESLPTNTFENVESSTDPASAMSKILRNRMPPPIPPFCQARQKFSKRLVSIFFFDKLWEHVS